MTIKRTRSTKASKPKGSERPNERVLRIGGNLVKLTNQNKVFWPDEGITKGDLVDYYNAMAKWILPHVKNRPMSLKRNPNGIRDKGFFHKDAGDTAPDWVPSVKLYSESSKREVDYILCNDRATLLYLANLGCIELDPWTSRVGSLDRPDHLVIDLDPSARNSFAQVVEAARATKVVLDHIGARSFCKTSGASGLHVYIPVKAKYTYDQLAPFAKGIALRVNELLPKTTTLVRSLAKRGPKIYLDHLQNRQGQTLASVYSVRPVPGATVSTPLEWREVDRKLDRSKFTIHSVPGRVARLGDLFKGVHGPGIDLAKCMRKLELDESLNQ